MGNCLNTNTNENMYNYFLQGQYKVCEKCFSENIAYLGGIKFQSNNICYIFKCSNNHFFKLLNWDGNNKDEYYKKMVDYCNKSTLLNVINQEIND